MRVALQLILVTWAPFVYAGPIIEMFHDGLFDVKWGDSIEKVKVIHPDGETTTVSGILTYEIKDGRTIVGIERKPDNYIQFLFNSEEKLNYVKVQFTLESTQESGALFTKLDELFGSDWKQPNPRNPTITWPKDDNLLVFFMTEFGNSKGNIENILMIKAETEIKATKEQLGF